MLTDKDIAFMKRSREQIQTKRDQTITLEIEGGYYHELTGEFIEENVSKDVVAILTEGHLVQHQNSLDKMDQKLEKVTYGYQLVELNSNALIYIQRLTTML